MSKNTRNTLIVIGIIVVILIIWLASQAPTSNTPGTSNTTNTPSTNNNTTLSPSTGGTVGTTPTAPKPVITKSFTIVANDIGSNLSVIHVRKGDVVQFTFSVGAQQSNKGGLDFRSDVVNTGAIAPLSSKSVVFTATKSFTITPYWPADNARKNYTISVVVE